MAALCSPDRANVLTASSGSLLLPSSAARIAASSDASRTARDGSGRGVTPPGKAPGAGDIPPGPPGTGGPPGGIIPGGPGGPGGGIPGGPGGNPGGPGGINPGGPPPGGIGGIGGPPPGNPGGPPPIGGGPMGGGPIGGGAKPAREAIPRFINPPIVIGAGPANWFGSNIGIAVTRLEIALLFGPHQIPRDVLEQIAIRSGLTNLPSGVDIRLIDVRIRHRPPALSGEIRQVGPRIPRPAPERASGIHPHARKG